MAKINVIKVLIKQKIKSSFILLFSLEKVYKIEFS